MTSKIDLSQFENIAQGIQSDLLSQEVRQGDPQVTSAVQLDRDTHGTNFLHSHAMSAGSSIKSGKIQHSLPFLNWYRVALEFPGGVLPCVNLSGDTGTQTIGPRDTSLLPPDSSVLVVVHPTNRMGYILGVTPGQTDDANFSFPDWVVQGGGVGLHKDAHHNQMLTLLDDEGGAQDYSAGRPIDQLTFDWGRMTETGVGVHIDPAMFFLRVDELCGIYGYQKDQFLRVAGYNMDTWSAAHTEEFRDDEGEATYFRGESPYPWEMLGSFSFGEAVHQETSDEDVIHNKPKSKYEPKEDQQAPFYRYREYGGYLGQGRIREVVIPPDNRSSIYTSTEVTDVPKAVFRESVSLDGTYALQSAKAVILAKKTLIPAPKKKQLPEDYSADGDSAANENYKFAGQHGDDAAEHTVGDLTTASDKPALVTAAAVMEMHAYTFNWKAVHAFHYHTGDYEFKNYSDMGSSSSTPFRPDFSRLGYDMWLDRPSAETAYVDHRYEDVEYFPVSSHVTLAEDGAVVIQGGQGEEIRMVGGSIQISCPGDVLLQPGRSVIALAGDDAIIRARKSVDITATENDVRLKAENNLQMLAANSGAGSMLLESRATGTSQHYPSTGGEQISGSGIILKAADGQIATMSNDLYLRTGVSGSYSYGGQICLDADSGNGNIRSIAASSYRYLTRAAKDIFKTGSANEPTALTPAGAADEDEWSINSFSKDGAIINTQLRLAGALHAQGNGFFAEDVKIMQGDYYSPNGGMVLAGGQELRQEFQALVEEQGITQEELRMDWETYVRQALYYSGKLGHRQTQTNVSFSLRSVDDYGSEGFVLPQTHWQILNESVGAGEAWEENNVAYGGYGDRQPWPGKLKWESADTFLRMEPAAFKLHDVDTNKPKDRDSAGYTERAYGDFTKSAPSEHYKVLSTK